MGRSLRGLALSAKSLNSKLIYGYFHINHQPELKGKSTLNNKRSSKRARAYLSEKHRVRSPQRPPLFAIGKRRTRKTNSAAAFARERIVPERRSFHGRGRGSQREGGEIKVERITFSLHARARVGKKEERYHRRPRCIQRERDLPATLSKIGAAARIPSSRVPTPG